jgi:hypothetical protein
MKQNEGNWAHRSHRTFCCLFDATFKILLCFFNYTDHVHLRASSMHSVCKAIKIIRPKNVSFSEAFKPNTFLAK